MFRNAALRLALFSALVILVILALSGTATYFSVRYLISNRLANDLYRAADAFQQSAPFQQVFPGGALLGAKGSDHVAHTLPTAFPTLLFDATGQQVGAVNVTEGEEEEREESDHPEERDDSAEGANLSLTKALAGQPDMRSVRSGDHRSQILSLPVVWESKIVGAVQFAARRDEDVRLLGLLQMSLLGVGLAGLLAALGGGYMLSLKAVSPLQEAFRRQGEFIADASHQLRTPVAVIRADAEALSRSLKNVPLEDAQLLEDLIAEADLMGRVIQQLIAGARLNANGQQVREPVDLKAMMHQVVEALGPLARQRDITISEDIQLPGDVFAKGDPIQLRLALMGILDNAVKYNNPGGLVTVTVEGTGRWGKITIADTGPGLTREEAARVFDRFYRGSSGRARAADGAGLGLPIALQIARAHGGDLTLSSEPGHGAKVMLTLPRID